MPRSAWIALRVVAAGALVALLVLFGRRIDWREVGEAMRRASLPLVVAAVARPEEPSSSSALRRRASTSPTPAANRDC